MSTITSRFVIVCISILLIGCITVSPLLVASLSDGYNISADNPVTIPDQTVTIDQETYSVSEFVTVQRDGSVTVTAHGPSDTTFELLLYNTERNIVSATSIKGERTVTVDVSGFEPGTYTFAIDGPQGSIRAVYPIVIEGYDFTVDAPAEATTGQSIVVSATLTQLEDTNKQPESVEVGVITGDTTEFVEMIQVSKNKYRAELTLDTTGTRTLVVGTRGADQVDNRLELTGVSSKQTLSVTTPTPTPTPTDPAPGGGGGGNDPSTEPPTTTSPSEDPKSTTGTQQSTSPTTESETVTPTPTPTRSATTPTTKPQLSESDSSPTDDTVTPSAGESLSPSPTPTSNVVTPAPTTATSTPTTDVTTPLSVLPVLAAFGCLVILLWRAATTAQPDESEPQE